MYIRNKAFTAKRSNKQAHIKAGHETYILRRNGICEGTNVCIFFDTQLMQDILNFYRTAFIKGLEKSKYSKTFLTDFRPVNLSSHEHLRKGSR